MSFKLTKLVLILATLLAAPALLAQASVSPLIFPNATEQVELVGTVTSFDFSAPESRIGVRVQGSASQSIEWSVITLSATELRRNGWTANSLFSGELVQIEGRRLPGQSLTIELISLTRANGELMLPQPQRLIDQIIPGSYRAASSGSFVDIYFDQFGFSRGSIRFEQIEAQIDIPTTGLEASQARLQLLLEDMFSEADLTRQLKSSQYLDASRYPIVEFRLEQIQITDGNRLLALGSIDVLGQRQEVTLFLHLNAVGPHPETGLDSIGLSGEARLSRAALGLSAGPSGIADQLDVSVELLLERVEETTRFP